MLMEYSIKRDTLRNDLLVEILHALSECYAAVGSEVYVVGAAARDIALKLLKVDDLPRRTLDLDVAVALDDWSQYERLTSIMQRNHFVKADERQRFFYIGKDGRNRYEVDVVPFGEVEENGIIAWPPEGSPVMSVRCFSEVMRCADKVTVDGVFSVRLASLSGQFLLKLDTWSDRHLHTKKDASDMVYILKNTYVAYALSRDGLPIEVDVEATTFDIIVAGAEWIASDLKKILSAENRKYYSELLRHEIDKEEESPLLNDLLDVSDSRNYTLFRRALNRMSQILMS